MPAASRLSSRFQTAATTGANHSANRKKKLEIYPYKKEIWDLSQLMHLGDLVADVSDVNDLRRLRHQTLTAKESEKRRKL